MKLELIERIVSEYGTPIFIYDAVGIRKSAASLDSAFNWAPRFRNFFAVKALPRLAILKELRRCGSGVECCSLPELVLAEQAGFHGSEVIYTCMYPSHSEISKASSLEAIVNLDYANNLDYLLQEYLPKTLLFRLNPGGKIEGNQILGVPRDTKFGSTENQVIDGIMRAHKAGIKQLGLHGMFASNMLDVKFFKRSAEVLLSLVAKLKKEHNISISCVDLGGGIGIPYREEDSAIDLPKLGEIVRTAVFRLVPETIKNNLHISMECGRYIVGPHGVFITRVLQVKRTYKSYVYVDGSVTHYPRPGVFGGYNKISVVSKRLRPEVECDVVGLLCDNTDYFCKNRKIPEVSEGDLLVVHDAGAHAASMSYDYNGRLKCREVLLTSDHTLIPVRHEQTISDYLQDNSIVI